MSLNHVELDAILSEWQLEGAVLQNVVQTDYEHYYFEWVKQAKSIWILACLASGLTRIHLSNAPPRQKAVQPRFCQFLRANLKGAQLNGFKQDDGERIIILSCNLDGVQYRLVFRLWSNNSNILLINNTNTILDAAFRRPLKDEMPGATHKALIGKDKSKKKLFTIREWPKLEHGKDGQEFNLFIQNSYQNIEQSNQIELVREQALRVWTQLYNKTKNRIQALENQLILGESHKRLKELGDLLLSNLHKYTSGSEWIEVEDWFNNSIVQIPLDSKKDAKANAEHYYQRFRKIRDSLIYLVEDKKRQESLFDRLELMKSVLSTSQEADRLADLLKNLETLSQGEKKIAGQSHQTRPGLSFVLWGHTLYIGRNAIESDALLRHFSRGNDLWMHVRDIPGGHVFIKTMRGKTPPLDLLLDAAHLAAWYSKAKSYTELDVVYTHVKYLRRAKHGSLGTVIPSQEKNLHLKIDQIRLKELLEN